MNEQYARRLDSLEQLTLEELAMTLENTASTPASGMQKLYRQIIAMNGVTGTDETTDNRLMALLLLNAHLRNDQPMVNLLVSEILKGLYDKKVAATEGEAYLFLSLFMVSRNPNYRMAGKRYVRQHTDIPPTLYRLMKLAKPLMVRPDAAQTVAALRQQKLMGEAAEKEIFVTHPSEVLTDSSTGGCPRYQLVTIEKGISNPSAYKTLKESRRPEYRPQARDDIQRLRCLGGMAASHRDPQYLMSAFSLLKARFEASTEMRQKMTVLEAMYHVAGCDGILLLGDMKQQCDTLFDQSLAGCHFPEGLFADEPVTDALAYRLLFCRHMPMPGTQTVHKDTSRRQWLVTLKRWADRLVSDSQEWAQLTLVPKLNLLRFILQTGFLDIADGDEHLATIYRNHVNATIFDSYLHLISAGMPEPEPLIACYPLLREWKYDIAVNARRYAEFMRVLLLCQSSHIPASMQWLQMEEVKTDYEESRPHSGHKLIVSSCQSRDTIY